MAGSFSDVLSIIFIVMSQVFKKKLYSVVERFLETFIDEEDYQNPSIAAVPECIMEVNRRITIHGQSRSLLIMKMSFKRWLLVILAQ